MSVDPELLRYHSVPDELLAEARARFRKGLEERMTRTGIDAVDHEPLIALDFVGISAPPDEWTLLRSDEPMTWYENQLPSDDELLATAESFGATACLFYEVTDGQ